MKKITIEFNERNEALIECGEEVTVTNLLKAGTELMEKARELTFYNEAYTAIEKIFDTEELDDEYLMKSVVILAEKVRRYSPLIEGTDFIAKMVQILFREEYFDRMDEAGDFLRNMSPEDFFYVSGNDQRVA